MSRQAIAVICAGSAIVVAAGCGGGSGSEAKRSSADAARARRLCPNVISAEKRYVAATTAMSIRFSKTRLVHRTVQASEALSEKSAELGRSGSVRDKRQLAALVGALSRQQQVLRAFERHDVAQASKLATNINAPLRQGLADLHTICRSA